MKALVTVLGKDKMGIIATVSALLAKELVNIEDISQTIMQNNFVLVMRVDLSLCPLSFDELADLLIDNGKKIGVTTTLRREDIFHAMHRI